MDRTIVADLHNHTTASDGEYTPTRLVQQAADIGLEAVAVTDHDTLSGLEEAIEHGHKLGITVIPGVEVTFRFRRPSFVGSLHLLLYFKNELLSNDHFLECAHQTFCQGRGPALVRDRVTAINEVFGPASRTPVLDNVLTIEQVMTHGDNITRRHFALALRENHGITDPRIVSNLIGNDSPAYVPSGIDPPVIRGLLERYDLLAVLAHPAAGSFPGESHYKEILPPLETVETLLPEFLDRTIVGINGIEVYHPGHTPEYQDLMRDWAKRYDLLVTGGSDCHDRSCRPLGIAGLSKDEYDLFYRRHSALAATRVDIH